MDESRRWRSGDFFATFPGALPQAGMGGACGPQLDAPALDLPISTRSPDQHDAYSVARWMQQGDIAGTLASHFQPTLSPPERTLAQLEGWLLGQS